MEIYRGEVELVREVILEGQTLECDKQTRRVRVLVITQMSSYVRCEESHTRAKL